MDIPSATMIGGAIVAIVVLSRIAERSIDALAHRKGNSNSRSGLNQAEHDMLLTMHITQKEIVDKMSRIVCDQRDLTKAVEQLVENIGKLDLFCGYESKNREA